MRVILENLILQAWWGWGVARSSMDNGLECGQVRVCLCVLISIILCSVVLACRGRSLAWGKTEDRVFSCGCLALVVLVVC